MQKLKATLSNSSFAENGLAATIRKGYSMTSCSFNEPILKSGDTGNAVQLLQTCLEGHSVQFAVPSINPGPIDGDFGPSTEAALKSFQTTFVPGSATPDGITGPITWSWLDQLDERFPFSLDLLKGASGNPVRNLQRILFAAGLDPGGVDGIYGNETAAAVEGFQKTEGLPPTGNADGQTRIQLGFVFPF